MGGIRGRKFSISPLLAKIRWTKLAFIGGLLRARRQERLCSTCLGICRMRIRRLRRMDLGLISFTSSLFKAYLVARF
jgi:hypothetical protein